jgi:hypothetical protein
MKLKISVVILFIFIFYFSANAQVKLTENFNYPANDTLGSYGWTSFSGGPTNPIRVVSPGLTFTNYALSGIGLAGRMANSGEDYYKQFTGDSVTSGSVYVSFMINVDSVKTGDYFVALLPPTSTTLYTSRFYIKDTSGVGLLFGISKGAASGGPIVYTTNIYQLHTTYLVVFKYKFNTGTTTDDEMSFYVFNTAFPSTEPTTPTLGPVVGTVNDATSFGRLGLRQGSAASSPTLVIDGISVATNWISMVGIKTISTVADKFSLSQNYPNPFNPVTNIKFSVPSNGYAKLSVYNALGQQVQSLVNNNLSTGEYSVQFDGTKLNSGMYFYKLELNSNDGKYFSDVKKLMLVK